MTQTKVAPRRARKVTIVSRLLQNSQRAIVAVGLREMHFYVGVLLATIGGAQYSVPITLIALGAVLSLVGLRGIR